MNNNIKNLTGKRFNRFTVLSFHGMRNNSSLWTCQCDCGNIKNILGYTLTNSTSKSCGCLHKEVAASRKKHGKCFSREYNIWVGMKQRCYNPLSSGFKDYGGRGVRVCDEWKHDFNVFISDMGLPPSHTHQLDRINNNLDYSPSNCKWSTRKQQMRNTSRNRLVLNIVTGVYYDTVMDACESVPMNKNTLTGYLRGTNKNKSNFIYV